MNIVGHEKNIQEAVNSGQFLEMESEEFERHLCDVFSKELGIPIKAKVCDVAIIDGIKTGNITIERAD